jgi:hypothetical protein
MVSGVTAPPICSPSRMNTTRVIALGIAVRIAPPSAAPATATMAPASHGAGRPIHQNTVPPKVPITSAAATC